MAAKKKLAGTKAKSSQKAPPRTTPAPPPYRQAAGARPYKPSGFRGYKPNLWVICTTLDKSGIAALLAEFQNPNQKFKVLMVKGSPFVSLSISPTRGGND